MHSLEEITEKYTKIIPFIVFAGQIRLRDGLESLGLASWTPNVADFSWKYREVEEFSVGKFINDC